MQDRKGQAGVPFSDKLTLVRSYMAGFDRPLLLRLGLIDDRSSPSVREVESLFRTVWAVLLVLHVLFRCVRRVVVDEKPSNAEANI